MNFQNLPFVTIWSTITGSVLHFFKNTRLVFVQKKINSPSAEEQKFQIIKNKYLRLL